MSCNITWGTTGHDILSQNNKSCPHDPLIFKLITMIINTIITIRFVTQVTHRNLQVLPIPQTISNCNQTAIMYIRPALASSTSFHIAHNNENQITCNPGTAHKNYTINVDFQITQNYMRTPAFHNKLTS